MLPTARDHLTNVSEMIEEVWMGRVTDIQGYRNVICLNFDAYDWIGWRLPHCDTSEEPLSSLV